MAIEEDIELLAQVELFSSFNHDQLRLLAFGAEARVVATGARLFRSDELSDGGYIVSRGEIQLTSGQDGRIISSHREGSLIAQMAIITETQHGADAIATQNSEVLKISRPLFRRVLREYPELAEQVRSKIEKSVLALTQQLDQVRIRLEQQGRDAA